jgi:hypothetical protein
VWTRNALRALEVTVTRAGLRPVGLHTLPHSAASMLLNSGVPLEVVSEVLGHSSIAITGDVYGHVTPDVSCGAMDALAAAFGDGGPPDSGQNRGSMVPRKRSGAVPDLAGYGP